MYLSSAMFCMILAKKSSGGLKSVDLSFSLNVKTVLLGLVDKKQLGIIFFLAKLHIYKALVNNTLSLSLHFKKVSNKNVRNNNISQLSPLPTKNLGIVAFCFLFLPRTSE